MKFCSTFGAVLLSSFLVTAGGIEFNPEDEASIRNVARQYAYGLMSLYKNNATGTPAQDIGIWPQPHYWWEGGAAWGGMIEYSQFTGDTSHVQTLQQALTANYGPANDFILSYRRSQTGNDDQAFWALAAMSALEYDFPDPAQAPASYLDVAVNAFNNMVGRWDTTSCNGGLKWQIYPENAYGYNYKNSISNGCAFALGARLARYTGNQTYADWAVKIYDWTKSVGLISDKYEVFDGTDDKTNCAKVSDTTQWTYNNAMFLHGSAFMFDVTKGDTTWKDRVSGFLDHANLLFFGPYDNATDIMYEWACETGESGRHCNLDQQSFKAYLARFIAKTAILAPFTKDSITKSLKASAVGAAKACSGGSDGVTCGSKWYAGAWDGTSGVGQQLSALEVTQALLMLQKGTVPVKSSGNKSVSSSSAAPLIQSKSATAPAPSSTAPNETSSKVSSPNSPVSSSQTAPPASSHVDDAKLNQSARPASSAPVAPAASSTTKSCVSTTPAPVKPSTGSKSSPMPVPSSTKTPAGEVGQSKQSSSLCTARSTVTVYVPLSSATPVPVVPSISTTITVIATPSNSTTKPSQPLEFQGAAVSLKSASGLVWGSLIAAMSAALL